MKLRLILLLGIALLALSSSLVKWLIQEGGNLGLTAPNAISFCNVLFVGNFCAGALLLAYFRPQRLLADWKQASASARGWLGLHVGFAVLIPSLLFMAIETTTVTNVILLGRFESVAYVVLALCLGQAQLGRMQWLGYGTIAVGIVVLALIQGMGQLQQGDYLVLLVASLQALAALNAKAVLKKTSLALFVFARNLGSAVIFFVVAMVLFGPSHFSEAFGPGLWVAMTVYALVVVVLGQLAWYHGLLNLPASVVSNLSLSSPLFGVLFACLLLEERPGMAQWLGGGIIVVGMTLTQLGKLRSDHRPGDQPLAGG